MQVKTGLLTGLQLHPIFQGEKVSALQALLVPPLIIYSKQTKMKEHPYIDGCYQGRGGFYMYVYKCVLAKSSSFYPFSNERTPSNLFITGRRLF
jgi:hypothetical protein